MKRAHAEALADLGITREKYVLDYDRKLIEREDDKVSVPKIWGLKLTHERSGQAVYIEYERDQYGGKPRYYIRRFQGAADYSKWHKLQRTAIAAVIKMWYGL